MTLLAAQDLLPSELPAIAEQLRGDDMARSWTGSSAPDRATSRLGPRPSGFVALRAGFLEPAALRLVDGSARSWS